LSIITDISLDHQKFLGNTVAEIAREKAGIIRPNGVVVTLPQSPQANEVIGNTILELGAHAVSAVPYVPPVSPGSDEYLARDYERFTTKDTRDTKDCTGDAASSAAGIFYRYPLQVMGVEIRVETPLVGRHQLRNLALAIGAAEELSKLGFRITSGAVERGIRNTRWPGRFQRFRPSSDAPEYLFDVAHNPAGAWALRSTLSACYENRGIVMVFGAMRDKAIQEVAEILFPLAERVIATRAENPRSATPAEIRQAAARIAHDGIEEAAGVAAALKRAAEAAGAQKLVVVTGSIYIVGEAMRILGVRV
jgi:dihydrofolate synthase/folylpolyglutamate synthase